MRLAPLIAASVALAAPVAPSCTRREPPTPDVPASAAAPDEPLSATAPPSPVASPPARSVGIDPARLPQTHDLPDAGAEFESRATALWEAVVRDDPARAMPFFFPLGAYQQVKNVANPAADWRHRLVAAYVHDIHALHARLAEQTGAAAAAAAARESDSATEGEVGGSTDRRPSDADSAARARFDGLDVPKGGARWVEPGEEYNKIGYYRVFGSKLRYEVGGATHAFDVKSLISWRGEWYVVHLSAIR